MKVALCTLGCKVNQKETAALAQLFRQEGFTVVKSGQAADVFVVNSCAVTAEGEAKSRRWLHRARRENPGAVTVLTGCLPQAFPEKAAAWGADVVSGTARRAALPGLVLAHIQSRAPQIAIPPPPKVFEPLPLAKSPGKTRAFVKVQDGCNRRCAYCVIPKARGASRSHGEDDILREIEALADEGFAEVVFTGINLPAYGRDTATSLARLVERAAEIPALRRIRLSSLEPDLLSPEEISRLAAQPKLCRHFHLSLQSGCDATLRAMRRPYTAALYAETAAAIRAAMPDASLTTDVIVGFPGESEADFLQSLAFVEEMEFLKVHAFPYSARAGTPAAEMEGQLPAAEKQRRAARLREGAEAARARWLAGFLGKTAEALLEQKDAAGRFTGYTGQYIPISLAPNGYRQGDILKVAVGPYDGSRCEATPLGKP